MKFNEEILRTFYQVERVTLRDSELHWNLSEGLIDRKLSHEIKNPKTDDVLVGAHKRVTEALYKELVKAKVPAAHVSVADLEGAFTVADLVNRQTGEVLLEANKPLTAEIWSALGEAEITSVDVFFPDRDDVGMVLSARWTRTRSSPARGADRNLSQAPPGRSANARNRHIAFQRHVFRPAQIRFQPRRPFEIQH